MANPEYTVPLDDAIALLKVEGEGDDATVHTFRNTGPMLIGADWPRDKLVELMRTEGVEEAGPQASAMGHTLILTDEHGPLFIETTGSYQRPASDG